jgi:hypothetical protein
MLRKYEWFKDVSAQLDKKKADIVIFESRLASLTSALPESRTEWDRHDKADYAQMRAELAGVESSFNGLAAEYNAQMAKFNWRFAEAGSLPEGATIPLPREHKPYSYGGN